MYQMTETIREQQMLISDSWRPWRSKQIADKCRGGQVISIQILLSSIGLQDKYNEEVEYHTKARVRTTVMPEEALARIVVV